MGYTRYLVQAAAQATSVEGRREPRRRAAAPAGSARRDRAAMAITNTRLSEVLERRVLTVKAQGC
jgi:hypothetical protein